jgi:serine/threonine-protein phosphatase with EF-hand domain
LSYYTCGFSTTGNLISHIFRENEVCRDTEWERHFCYKNIEVPEIYSGPRLIFPLTVEQVAAMVEAFRNKRVGAFMYSQNEIDSLFLTIAL